MLISKDRLNQVLGDTRREPLEALAREAARLTRQHFGRTIGLYAPLYLSNYCSSHCTYCGFNSRNKISRLKLTPDQYSQEMRHIHGQGIRNILLLTGESHRHTPLAYLKTAVGHAGAYFQGIALEVHPMQTDEYRELFAAGVDGITVYQETYDRSRYAQVHLSGYKKDFEFRRATPQRAAAAGMRQIAMGILLGLSADLGEDLASLYAHLRAMEQDYPGVEYSLSFPRLRTVKSREFARCDIDDITYTKVLCLTRVLFPRVGLNLSTRENPRLRDHLLKLAITRMSAGSNTSVGGYSLLAPAKQDPQFDIQDERTIAQVVAMLKSRDFDPVFTDWRRIENAPLDTSNASCILKWPLINKL